MAWFAVHQEWGGGPIEYQTVARRRFAQPADSLPPGAYRRRGAY